MRTIKLCRGMGQLGHSHCVMAATSIVAGEGFTARPTCVDSLITNVLTSLNDALSDNIRDKLLSHLPWIIIGTACKEDDEKKLDVFNTRSKLLDKYIKKYYSGNYLCKSNTLIFIEANSAFNRIDLEEYLALNRDLMKLSPNQFASATERMKNLSIKARFILDKNEDKVKHFVDFIENELVPVYTTMPIEPEYNIEKLVTV